MLIFGWRRRSFFGYLCNGLSIKFVKRSGNVKTKILPPLFCYFLGISDMAFRSPFYHIDFGFSLRCLASSLGNKPSDSLCNAYVLYYILRNRKWYFDYPLRLSLSIKIAYFQVDLHSKEQRLDEFTSTFFQTLQA
jgi:hypothetical protein